MVYTVCIKKLSSIFMVRHLFRRIHFPMCKRVVTVLHVLPNTSVYIKSTHCSQWKYIPFIAHVCACFSLKCFIVLTWFTVTYTAACAVLIEICRKLLALQVHIHSHTCLPRYVHSPKNSSHSCSIGLRHIARTTWYAVNIMILCKAYNPNLHSSAATTMIMNKKA